MVRKSKATLKDVARKADVSEATASRALAGSDLISEQTRNLVVSVANEIGYKSRNKANKTSNQDSSKGVIGVVVAALGNSFYPYLVDRVHGELNLLGYDMVLLIDEFSNSRGSRNIRSILNNSLDGVIFMTSSIHSEAVDFLVESQIPTVLAIRSNQKGNVDVLESDNLIVGVQAMEHLISLGHRKIAMLMGPKHTSTASERYRGAFQEMERQQIKAEDDFIMWGDFTHESGYSNMMRLWNAPEKPTAVFCGNDVIAIGAMDACLKLGLTIPDDISIIGVDDAPMSSWSMISLTTVRQNIEEIGLNAARRIVERVESSNSLPVRNDIFPTGLIPRSTTNKPK